MDTMNNDYVTAKVDYMAAKREENMFKMLDHNKNLQRVNSVKSAYKRHLVGKSLKFWEASEDSILFDINYNYI